MTTDEKTEKTWRRIIIWASVLAFIVVIIIPLPFLIDEPVCVQTYLNTRTFEYESYVRVGPLVFEQDSASFFQGDLEPYRNAVRQERLPEYWICIYMQSYTLLGSPIFHEVRGGKYPTKLRFFLMEHYQEMMDPDYKETEEEFSARFTDYILSLNDDEFFKRVLLPADTDLRARSF